MGAPRRVGVVPVRCLPGEQSSAAQPPRRSLARCYQLARACLISVVVVVPAGVSLLLLY